ncbi:MAG: DUF3854 domain-containing protein, partial [Alkalinema sp. RL_2_19]|nr:DUF3854 domain-containing protein [Alkalinema sp. RL_2_19]
MSSPLSPGLICMCSLPVNTHVSSANNHQQLTSSFNPAPFKSFTQEIEQECCQGSAIDVALFATCVQLTGDTILQPGGEVSYPIHDALNWRMTRFGKQARQNQSAALFLNEDQSCWQAKLADPIWDKQKQKARKYETPVGAGSRAYFPPVPAAIRQQIADRYELAVPEAGSFWQWVKHANVPIVMTEGAKKA